MKIGKEYWWMKMDIKKVGGIGFEPMTSCMSSKYSNQLS